MCLTGWLVCVLWLCRRFRRFEHLRESVQFEKKTNEKYIYTHAWCSLWTQYAAATENFVVVAVVPQVCVCVVVCVSAATCLRMSVCVYGWRCVYLVAQHELNIRNNNKKSEPERQSGGDHHPSSSSEIILINLEWKTRSQYSQFFCKWTLGMLLREWAAHVN